MKIFKLHFHIYPSFLIFLWILPGCGSRVPMAPVSMGISDDRIVGIWQAMDPSGRETIEMSIFKFNEKEYFAEIREEKRDSLDLQRDTMRVRAYIIEIENKRFFNIQLIESLEEEERGFFFFEYCFDDKQHMRIRALDSVGNNRINDFIRSDSLYHYIEANINDENLYEETIEFKPLKNISP